MYQMIFNAVYKLVLRVGIGSKGSYRERYTLVGKGGGRGTGA